MLQSPELFTLARSLASTNVLTAYVNRRVANPSERHAWRPAVAAALSATRQTITDPAERRAFDDASTLLTHTLAAAAPANAHAVFVTSDNVVHHAALPSSVDTRVAWRSGLAIAPYIRVLETQSAALVAAVHSRTIHLYRYNAGMLELLGEFDAGTASVAPRKHASELRGRVAAGPRNATSTELARRRDIGTFDRLAEAAIARLAAVATDDAVILVAGDSTWATRFADALPGPLLPRVIVERSVLTGPREIIRKAKNAAVNYRRAQSRELVTRVVTAMGGKAVSGANAVLDAIEFRALDTLLLSEHAIRARWYEVEDIIGAAIAQGAKVKTLSGEGAAALDRACHGVAARTRFAFEARTPVSPMSGAPPRDMVLAAAAG